MKSTRKEFILNGLFGAAGLSGIARHLDRLLLPSYESVTRGSRSRLVKYPISVFSKHLQWLDYRVMAARASELGFDGVDLTVRPGGHVLPERVREDLPTAVEAVRSEGLEVFMISTAITDADDRFTEPILKTAGQLDIPSYRLGWLEYDRTQSIPENLNRFETKLTRLAEMNLKHAIRGDCQNHAGTSLGSSIWDLWLVLRNIDSPWLGCQFDIRHATVEGAHSWQNDFQLIGPYVGTLDIKDFRWVGGEEGLQLRNVPLGEGMVDFPTYFSLLKQNKIMAPISLHYEYPLGGAEHGATSLNIDEEAVLDYLKRDLHTLRAWLSRAGITE